MGRITNFFRERKARSIAETVFMRCFKRCTLLNRVKFSVLNPVCINAGNCCKAQCCEVFMTKTVNQSDMTGFLTRLFNFRRRRQ